MKSGANSGLITRMLFCALYLHAIVRVADCYHISLQALSAGVPEASMCSKNVNMDVRTNSIPVDIEKACQTAARMTQTIAAGCV